MQINLKKALSIFLVVCFSATPLFAGAYDQKDNSDSDQSRSKVAVPPGVHAGEDGPSFFITADYTYWVAREAGLAYAVSNEYGVSESGYPVTDTPSRGSVFYPNWKGRSGFKVGAGAYLGHDGWDLYSEYTWFYNKQQKGKYEFANFAPGLGQATWPVYFTYIDEAAAFWANWFNRIDLQLARAYYVGHYLQMRPFIGLLGAWEQQWYNVGYAKLVDRQHQEDVKEVYANVWFVNQKWWGIGPWAGFETAFLFPWGNNSNQWSLFLDFGSALPWAQAKVRKQLLLAEEALSSSSTTTDTIAYTYDNCWNAEPMLEIALGLRWEIRWSETMNWNFMLQAAWEEQVWFAHNHMTPFTYEAVAGLGNYSMQGFTLKGRVGF